MHISAGEQKQRNTNLELFRIITMLLIIAHHYVVNSGLLVPIYENPMLKRSLFLLVFGAWGKTGINCFVLITGYFMCKSTMSARRYVKLHFEAVFYYFIINSVFWITGYSSFSGRELFGILVPICCIADGFGPAYLLFLLCIPFLNLLLRSMSQRMHVYLILLLFMLYVVPETLKAVCILRMNYVSWFAVLYILAAYVRMYPNKLFDNTKFWGITCMTCILITALTVVGCTWLGTRLNRALSYYFVTDSNTFLALATGFSSFMFFKNVKIPYSPPINKLASACFGVLLIHATNDTMRKWLWVDLLNNVGVYYELWMPIHAVLSVLAIFLIGAAIDLLRIQFVEVPFFKLWDKHWPQVTAHYKRWENKIFSKLHIG